MSAHRSVFALLLVAGCTEPEIIHGTYFCGKNGLCPPDQVCDEITYTCELPSLARTFTCPEELIDVEPDGELEQARDLGELPCNQVLLQSSWGCAAGPDDLDHFRFSVPESCAGGNPRLEITVRYPVAMATVELVLLDESGTEIAGGEPCDPEINYSGTEYFCIDRADIAPATYFVRAALSGQDNCDGGCAYNQYALDVRYPYR